MALREIGAALAALGRRHQLAPVDRRRRRSADVPDVVAAARRREGVADVALAACLVVDRHRDEIVADLQAIAIGQLVRALHARCRAVEEGAVARHVV
jgi:hypothetical protein